MAEIKKYLDNYASEVQDFLKECGVYDHDGFCDLINNEN